MTASASLAALHFNVSSLEAHRKFWIDALGGVSALEAVTLPHVTLVLHPRPPAGGTKGTSINHVGFQVPSARAAVDRLRAAGYPIVTATEVSSANAGNIKDGLAFIESQNTFIAYTMSPDEVKVELVENKDLAVPLDLHHIHFFTPQVDEMRAWYVSAFGATPGRRGSFEAADLPGVNFSFSPAAELQAATKGRVLDRIAFDAKGLDLPPGLMSDAWGTQIEITKG